MALVQSRSLRVGADSLAYLDQTRLPQVEQWAPCDTPEAWQAAVKRLARRAPDGAERGLRAGAVRRAQP